MGSTEIKGFQLEAKACKSSPKLTASLPLKIGLFKCPKRKRNSYSNHPFSEANSFAARFWECKPCTLPETNIFAHENGWLEYDRFLFGRPSVRCYVSFGECKSKVTRTVSFWGPLHAWLRRTRPGELFKPQFYQGALQKQQVNMFEPFKNWTQQDIIYQGLHKG